MYCVSLSWQQEMKVRENGTALELRAGRHSWSPKKAGIGLKSKRPGMNLTSHTACYVPLEYPPYSSELQFPTQKPEVMINSAG